MLYFLDNYADNHADNNGDNRGIKMMMIKILLIV